MTSSDRKVHERTHSGNKPFLCDFPGCNKRFDKPSRLAAHKRIHTGERPYKCTYPGCHHSYTTAAGLHQHQRRHWISPVDQTLTTQFPVMEGDVLLETGQLLAVPPSQDPSSILCPPFMDGQLDASTNDEDTQLTT